MIAKADHPRMRAFSYAWSLPVTWQRLRSVVTRFGRPAQWTQHGDELRIV